LQSSLPVFLAYVLSYVNVGIFWNNHHHMLHAAARIGVKVLWANLILLFWMSLIPFVIRWMDEAGLTALPTAAYGVVLANELLTKLRPRLVKGRVQRSRVEKPSFSARWSLVYAGQAPPQGLAGASLVPRSLFRVAHPPRSLPLIFCIQFVPSIGSGLLQHLPDFYQRFGVILFSGFEQQNYSTEK
jgi:hypothetical protein